MSSASRGTHATTGRRFSAGSSLRRAFTPRRRSSSTIRGMQSSRSDERREFQRLLLSPAVPATLGTTNVTIIEIGVLGARVVHDTPLDGDRGELRFDSNGQMISMRCEVVRTFNTDGMQSGLRFVAAIGDSGDRLREMLGQLVTRELDERRDATQGTMLKAAIDGDKTVRGKDAGFVCYRLANNS